MCDVPGLGRILAKTQGVKQFVNDHGPALSRILPRGPAERPTTHSNDTAAGGGERQYPRPLALRADVTVLEEQDAEVLLAGQFRAASRSFSNRPS